MEQGNPIEIGGVAKADARAGDIVTAAMARRLGAGWTLAPVILALVALYPLFSMVHGAPEGPRYAFQDCVYSGGNAVAGVDSEGQPLLM